MSETKPQVFPNAFTKEQIEDANDATAKKNEQLIESERVRLEKQGPSAGELAASELMRKKTEEQLAKGKEKIGKLSFIRKS